jgi:hypothetical protein
MDEKPQEILELPLVVDESNPPDLTDPQVRLKWTARWTRSVLLQTRGRCANCGSDDRVQVKMIVPEDAGGVMVVSNGTAHCRACELAHAVVTQKKKPDADHPVNFWLSRGLYDQVKAYNGFSSTSSLVRFLVDRFAAEPSRFDDLPLYQDEGCDVKINAWVPPASYEVFKELVTERGLTVTDALKCLLKMYGCQVDPLLPKAEGVEEQ